MQEVAQDEPRKHRQLAGRTPRKPRQHDLEAKLHTMALQQSSMSATSVSPNPKCQRSLPAGPRGCPLAPPRQAPHRTPYVRRPCPVAVRVDSSFKFSQSHMQRRGASCLGSPVALVENISAVKLTKFQKGEALVRCASSSQPPISQRWVSEARNRTLALENNRHQLLPPTAVNGAHEMINR